MKISINWLKDFVNLDGISNEELLKRLTLSTAEIEEVVNLGQNTNNVVVGKIVFRELAKNSSKLNVLKVDTGDKIYDVICGAPNCRVGMNVAFVKVGGEVNGFKIEKAIIAGYVSEGMCCSEKELGISDNHEEILEILEDAPLGTDVKELYQIEDSVFEIDNKSLTNRPDLWCHYGFAREVAAIFNRTLKPLQLVDLDSYKKLSPLYIKIEDSEKCYRYCGIQISNITKKISPMKMKIRLFYTGMRSLNLLADLTNYIMLEVGQPMHAFDSTKAQNIVVKTFDKPFDFITLDKEIRNIDTKTLMICENDTPLAIAGIMGGLDSEIKEDTTSILLESANFYAISTRKSANALALRTEASLRYEKSLDPELTIIAVRRFIALLMQIDKDIKVTSSLTDLYPHKYKTIVINTTTSYIESYCGIPLKTQEIINILKSLEFGVESSGENLKVTVPSFRATKDVSIAADLVEEVSRIYGYDNIAPLAVKGKFEPVLQEAEHILEYQVKTALAEKFNLSEVHTYLWKDVASCKELNIQTKGYVKVLNSTVKDNDELRSELISSLLKIVNENKSIYNEAGIFEIGRVITGLDKNNLAIEEKHLGVTLVSKEKTEEELYFEIKRILEFLMITYKKQPIELKIQKANTVSYLHSINNASIVCNGKTLGIMGLLHPAVLNAIDKKLKVAVLEINFNEFSKIEENKVKVKELSKYQTTVLDFNFLAEETVVYAALQNLFENFVSPLDYTFKLKDTFKDEIILKNKISYTFSFEIGSKDHTLTSKEIEEFSKNLIVYASKNGLELR